MNQAKKQDLKLEALREELIFTHPVCVALSVSNLIYSSVWETWKVGRVFPLIWLLYFFGASTEKAVVCLRWGRNRCWTWRCDCKLQTTGKTQGKGWPGKSYPRFQHVAFQADPAGRLQPGRTCTFKQLCSLYWLTWFLRWFIHWERGFLLCCVGVGGGISSG